MFKAVVSYMALGEREWAAVEGVLMAFGAVGRWLDEGAKERDGYGAEDWEGARREGEKEMVEFLHLYRR